jgi:anti-sigma regulatory factor (Ser/Thr protein kinase)
MLYSTAAEYLDGVMSFVTAGIDAGDAVLVAVPTANLATLREALSGAGDAVTFIDNTELARNPARIIPAVLRFVEEQSGRHVRIVGEPIWAGRSPAEVTEATRHEAMVNAAFAGTDVEAICPYDVSGLDPAVIADAWRTHPRVIEPCGGVDSPHYDDPTGLYANETAPLDDPPAGARTVPVNRDDLREVRSLIRGFATQAGVPTQRTQDLVLAANEIATNTVAHTDGDGVLAMWRDAQSVVCEIRDSGHISDPFAGRRLPDYTSDHGRGLWLANQLCDLVQLRSSRGGTTIRMYVAP